MRKRICNRSSAGRTRLAMRAFEVGLIVGSLGAFSGCGDSSSGVPSDDEGLIEVPVEDGSGEGNVEFTSERKAE